MAKKKKEKIDEQTQAVLPQREEVDAEQQKKNEKMLDDSLISLKETFPSFIRYAYDWHWVASPNSMNGIGGYVRPLLNLNDKKTMEVVAFNQIFKQGENKLKGFIIHEMLHVYNDHFERKENNIKDITIAIKGLKIKDDNGNDIESGVSYYPSLWNVATDLAINYTIQNYLNGYKIELPDNGLTCDLFPDEIRQKIEDKDAETIFYVLKKAYEEDTENLNKMLQKIAQQIIENQMKNGNNGGQPQPQQGQGNGPQIVVNVNFDDHGELQKMADGPDNKDLSDKLTDDGRARDVESKEGKEGGGWSHVQSSDMLDKIIKNMIIKQTAKVDLRKIIKDIRGEITSKSSSLTPVFDFSYKRMNRKKSTIANRYGVSFKGKAKYYKQKELIVALDTSGSVSENDLEMAFNVINSFLKDHHFSIHFIQCDCKVYGDELVKKPMHNVEVQGRGSTNYQPVFNHIKKNYLQKGKNNKNILLCYIGDGQTSYEIENFGINTIWIFTKDYDTTFYSNVAFGKKYKIPDLTNRKFI